MTADLAARLLAALRTYQRKALQDLRDAYRRGARAILLVLPTGGGKTITACALAAGHLTKGGRRVLVVVHRVELARQTVERLRAEGFDRVGILAPAVTDDVDLEAPVVVASIQTMVARSLRPDASLVVFDECHHLLAETWAQVAEHYDGVPILGLTGTPERSDGKPLGDIFDAMVLGPTVKELTALGFLVPARVIAPQRRVQKLIQDPVDAYLQHGRGRRAFVFCEEVLQAESVATRARAAGITAACVHANTPADERLAAVDAFRRGDIQMLTNCFVFTEGTDIPEAAVCIIARGFGFAGTYLQAAGRVLRPAPGKTEALIVDLLGCSRRHGRPDSARQYSLGGKRGIRLLHPVRRGRRRPLEVERGDLVEVTDVDDRRMPDERRSYYLELIQLAHQRGYRHGWVAHRFKERFGEYPRRRWAA